MELETERKTKNHLAECTRSTSYHQLYTETVTLRRDRKKWRSVGDPRRTPYQWVRWEVDRIHGQLASLLTFSPIRTVPAWIMTCQCYRSSAISVVIWFVGRCYFGFGLPRFRFPSTVICNIFLVTSSLSRLRTCPNHINLFSLRNSATGYMCASFQMSTFLTLSSRGFPLALI